MVNNNTINSKHTRNTEAENTDHACTRFLDSMLIPAQHTKGRDCGDKQEGAKNILASP